MNLVEFHNNLRTEVTMENPSELIEQNMVIYELLKACFPSDIGIAVTNRQDSICYKISVPPGYDRDYIQSRYNDIKVTLYSRNYSVKVWMEGSDICIILGK